MGLYEYLYLNLDQRADLLWSEGLFIDTFAEAHNTIKLYSLSDFYVEVTVSNADQKIIDVHPFKKGLRLEKYLDKINFNNLS